MDAKIKIEIPCRFVSDDIAAKIGTAFGISKPTPGRDGVLEINAKGGKGAGLVYALRELEKALIEAEVPFDSRTDDGETRSYRPKSVERLPKGAAEPRKQRIYPQIDKHLNPARSGESYISIGAIKSLMGHGLAPEKVATRLATKIQEMDADASPLKDWASGKIRPADLGSEPATGGPGR